MTRNRCELMLNHYHAYQRLRSDRFEELEIFGIIAHIVDHAKLNSQKIERVHIEDFKHHLHLDSELKAWDEGWGGRPTEITRSGKANASNTRSFSNQTNSSHPTLSSVECANPYGTASPQTGLNPRPTFVAQEHQLPRRCVYLYGSGARRPASHRPLPRPRLTTPLQLNSHQSSETINLVAEHSTRKVLIELRNSTAFISKVVARSLRLNLSTRTFPEALTLAKAIQRTLLVEDTRPAHYTAQQPSKGSRQGKPNGSIPQHLRASQGHRIWRPQPARHRNEWSRAWTARAPKPTWPRYHPHSTQSLGNHTNWADDAEIALKTPHTPGPPSTTTRDLSALYPNPRETVWTLRRHRMRRPCPRISQTRHGLAQPTLPALFEATDPALGPIFTRRHPAGIACGKPIVITAFGAPSPLLPHLTLPPSDPQPLRLAPPSPASSPPPRPASSHSGGLDWDSDPRLVDLSNAQRSLGWIRPLNNLPRG
ncbi:hypothetical protein BD779DRAFT_1474587 [Infundibulicybe gibba]|nr:hypothetical protein BD779DRAFT_1474587 [Infundibulicybe gibba]